MYGIFEAVRSERVMNSPARMKKSMRRLRIRLQPTEDDASELCDVEVQVTLTVCAEPLARLKKASLTCTLQQILVGVKGES